MGTESYTIGKGSLRFKADGETGYTPFGNCPDFKISTAVDELEHTSSEEGLSNIDMTLKTKMTMTATFTADELTKENLRKFILAETAADTTQTAAALGGINNVVLPDTNALGRWYELYKDVSGAATFDAAATADSENVGTATLALTGAANHATASHNVQVQIITTGASGTFRLSIDNGDWGTIRTLTASAYPCVAGDGQVEDIILTFANAANLVIGDVFLFNVTYTATATNRVYNIDDVVTAAESFTLTVGTLKTEGVDGVGHYQVDRKAGLVYINPTQPASPILASDTLVITAKLLAGTKSTSLGSTKPTIQGMLYFRGSPPKGTIVDVIGYCSLSPTGDLALIGDTVIGMNFTAKFLKQVGVEGLLRTEIRGVVTA
jgi:hypothetical protein